MKKSMIIAAITVLLTGCGVGNYSIQSGVEDAAFISFTDDVKRDITVTVDEQTFCVQTIRQKAYKSGRDIKQTSLNTIKITPGQHEIKVLSYGAILEFDKKIFISTGEHKIIEL